MTTLLPTLAVAFAAFCVWLTVRIVNRREGRAKWIALGLSLGGIKRDRFDIDKMGISA